ncbi:MAG: hypothetical protein IPK27_15170 [Rhodanobacteraceae bacterium]|nr:hypothetical protein [Rhodanobacteraceae bacterium]
MFKHLCRLLVLGLLGPAQCAMAATYCVNFAASDAARTHSTVHDAILSAESNGPGEDTIKLSTGTHLAEPVSISGQVRIVGGYTNCSASTPSNTSRIDGGNFNGSIFRIVQFISAPRLYLERVGLTNGDDSDDGLGGAIEARGPGTVVEFGPDSGAFTNSASGSGGAIHLTGATLLLGHGSLLDNNAAGGDGGAIYCDGGRVLQGVEGNTTQTSTWRNNRAGRDGGALAAVNGCTVELFGGSAVSISGNTSIGSGGAFLLLNSSLSARLGTLISGNSASEHGGGIYCGGVTTLAPSQVNLIDSGVQSNTAALDGGGMRGAQACTLSLSGATLVASNQATRGGGAALADAATLMANRSAPGGPLVQVPASAGPRIILNRACGGGAGIQASGAARIRLRGAVVSGNLSIGTSTCGSEGGGGILMQSTTGDAQLLISLHDSCPDDEPCNQINDNLVDNTSAGNASLGFEARGGGLVVQSGSVCLIENATLTGNRALARNGTLIPNDDRADGAALQLVDCTRLTLRHAVIAGNTGDGELASILYLGANALLDYVTIARNILNTRVINGGALISRPVTGTGVTIRSSILDDTDFKLLDVNGGSPMLVAADCSLVRRIGELPNQTRLTSLPAVFVDPLNGDFRPAPNGPQIDYCDGPTGQGLEYDLDLASRGLPNPSIVQGFGNYDAGAYESKVIDDLLLRTGFE